MKRALITGASSGIGKALAYFLASKGFSLLLTGRDQERLSQVGKEVGAEVVFAADLTLGEERKKVVDLIRAKIPDLVINCAGLGFYGTAFSLSVDEQLAILEVNAIAALELTLEAVQTMAKKDVKGVVLNVSSVAGEYPCPGMSVYGASKSFLTHVSRALNLECQEKGIHVLVSCPGMVETPFATRAAKRKEIRKEGPVLSLAQCVEEIWSQIEKRQEKRIIDWRYRLICFFGARFLPVKSIQRLVWKQIKKRI